ncbi:polysaccharide deacetylase [Mucilaginibacter phyllosphaerae]|uniref:Polysaccharide deacetylase n=2 Tax=Mucilaginibacter phyllosphaerae TaxID=1812349 RepID=A0A4Y8AC12_9SPHI|nr:polysaccharide deacetylase [Mucilaginibacter phyllosphaerae]
MMKALLRIVFVLLTLFYSLPANAQVTYGNIKNYQAYYGWAKRYPQDWLILRRFENNGKPYLLMVNPQTLQTKVNDAGFYQIKPMSFAEARKLFGSTPYQKALSKAESQSVTIQDAGIERGLPKETGISLTADLCPSHRPLERKLFTDLINGFSRVEKPVPIALSVSGLWMKHHMQDLAWLKQLQANQQIYITWINHSFNHRVSSTNPLKTNFLLEPGTDINYEVLETEKLMLANGLLPSVFFRFPGLVSDQQLVYQITGFGLIPIGTDAWLAKGQQPQAGSIVLIHGNGNEPVGVNDFIKLLQSKAKAIAGKQWLLYDLRETVEEEAEVK